MRKWISSVAGSVFLLTMLCSTVSKANTFACPPELVHTTHESNYAYCPPGIHYQYDMEQSDKRSSNGFREIQIRKCADSSDFISLNNSFLNTLAYDINQYYKTLFLYFISAKAP